MRLIFHAENRPWPVRSPEPAPGVRYHRVILLQTVVICGQVTAMRTAIVEHNK